MGTGRQYDENTDLFVFSSYLIKKVIIQIVLYFVVFYFLCIIYKYL